MARQVRFALLILYMGITPRMPTQAVSYMPDKYIGMAHEASWAAA